MMDSLCRCGCELAENNTGLAQNNTGELETAKSYE